MKNFQLADSFSKTYDATSYGSGWRADAVNLTISLQFADRPVYKYSQDL